MSKFVWKIENFSCLKGEEFVCSFPFSSRTTERHLSITQNDSEILTLVPDIENAEYHRFLVCSVSFLDSDGTPLIYNECTLKSASSNCNKPTKMDVLKFPNAPKYFPYNILRVECCVWWINWDTLFSPNLLHFAVTRVEPTSKRLKKTFELPILDFTNSRFSTRINDALWNRHNLEIHINLLIQGPATISLSTQLFGFYANIKVFLLNASKKMIEIGNFDAKFIGAKRSFTFYLKTSRSLISRYADKFLISGTLSFVVTCTFSGHFSTDTVVEESDIFNNTSTNNVAIGEIPETQVDETDLKEPITRQQNDTEKPITIIQTLQTILNKGYLSDFSLKVGDRIFPVHKAILGTRSKFFSAMFDSEMKEVQDNSVDIKDVDGDTLEKMLQFVYWDSIDDNMDWEEASSLYAAADFYDLEPLKQGCSAILIDGLSSTNALGILTMGDLHHDRQLKSEAIDFISLNNPNIVGSEEWIKFEKENGSLALETLRELYTRKVKG